MTDSLMYPLAYPMGPISVTHPVIELVAYQTKTDPAQQHSVLIQQTNAGLSKLPGYGERQVFQDVHEPANLVDWVSWDTLNNAVQGAKSMNSIPELLSFVGLIERTQVFDHFKAHDYHAVTDAPTRLVELLIYELNPDVDSAITAFFRTYSHELAITPGYQNRTLLQSTSQPNRWAEWVYWESLAAAQANEAAMQTNTELMNVFSLVDAILVKQYIQPFAQQ